MGSDPEGYARGLCALGAMRSAQRRADSGQQQVRPDASSLASALRFAVLRGQISVVTETTPLWIPSEADIASANVTRFVREVVQPLGGRASRVADSVALYEWSVE